MNDQQKTVADFLESEKINYAVRYVGETMRDNNWECDAWHVSFAAGKNYLETDYYTGLGHRKPTKLGLMCPEAKFPKKSIGYHEWEKQYVNPFRHAPPMFYIV